MQAVSLSTVDTLYSADAIEFCPNNPRLFACGTYQIEKDESAIAAPPPIAADDEEEGEDEGAPAVEPVVTRYGRCLMYEIDEDGRNLYVLPHPTTFSLHQLTAQFSQTRSSTL
jgi:diphthine methyl ester acylhydrolase